jgi:uncharacterized protein YdcH (DUF465 family)
MTKIIFSGIDKAFFDSLIFNKKVRASWLSIDELMSAGTQIDIADAKLVVLYTSPEVFLSALGAGAIGSLDQAEQQWLPQTELLTQLYLANKDNAILVNSEQSEMNFAEFTSLLNTKFNIDSQLLYTSKASKLSSNEGAKLVAQSLQLALLSAISDNYDIQSTYENVMSAADLLIASDDYTPEERVRSLRETCQDLVKKVKAKDSEYKRLLKEDESKCSKIRQLVEKLETAKKSTSKLKKNIVQLSSEIKLSVSQVQQVQEELELVFSQNNALKLQLNDSQSKQKDADENTSLLISKSEQLANLQAENEIALLQVQQLQEELESLFSQNNALKTQLNDSQSKQKDADENTLLQISKNEPLADLQAENEIALLQIQQLQEELEFYFIKYQSLIVNPVINNVIPINFADKRFEKSLSLARLLNT